MLFLWRHYQNPVTSFRSASLNPLMKEVPMQIDVDGFVEPLATKLARLVAVEVEIGLLTGMTAVQRELLEQACELRKSESELDQQLAIRLAAACERVGRIWDELGESAGGPVGGSGRNRRPSPTIAIGAMG